MPVVEIREESFVDPVGSDGRRACAVPDVEAIIADIKNIAAEGGNTTWVRSTPRLLQQVESEHERRSDVGHSVDFMF